MEVFVVQYYNARANDNTVDAVFDSKGQLLHYLYSVKCLSCHGMEHDYINGRDYYLFEDPAEYDDVRDEWRVYKVYLNKPGV